MEGYNHKDIERKWQEKWQTDGLYNVPDKVEGKENFYTLVEFPYPSGNLHIGHWYAFAVPDIFARFKRMQGHNVLYPIGFDSFGLPAENAAIKRGLDPRKWTYENIDYMSGQLRSMGNMFDWNRKVVTSDPEYYKWTQWLFIEFFKKGLAYKKPGLVNWCPSCQTVLANEQVVDGACERCGTEVTKKDLEQWYFKITDYAERLLSDLDNLGWPEQIKDSQRNWIGKSEGAEFNFRLKTKKKRPRFVVLHGFEGSAHTNFIPWLKEALGKQGYEVEAPELPNSHDPKESEQVEYVLNNCTLDEHTVLIGHSLGAVVGMKVLMKLDKPISGFVAVAAAIDSEFPNVKEAPYHKNFSWSIDYSLVQKNASNRIAVLSDTRETNRKSYLQYLSKKLDAAFIEAESNEEHFTDTEEPAILDAVTPQIKVFTTRPDTLFGVTYIVLAPEHPWVQELLEHVDNTEEVKKYIQATAKKTEIERTDAKKEKTGVELKGVTATNPATGEEISVWVADYVLAHYGTGAVMAVPAHDERDFSFARKYDLPIKYVVLPQKPDPSNPHVPGKDVVFRNSVIALVTSPKDNSVLILRWKKHPWTTFVMGGIEEGEDMVEGALREIQEETGYKNVKFIKQICGPVQSEYYAAHKEQNRVSHSYPLLFELIDEEKEEISEEEASIHDIEWMPLDKVCAEDITHVEADVILESLRNGEKAYTGEGILNNSGEFNKTPSFEAREKIVERFGIKKTTYKLRDWLLSRQRYWGCPIPIVYDPEGNPHPVPEEHLPWVLPEDDIDLKPKGTSPLGSSKELVERTKKIFGEGWMPEIDTMDTFVDSSWYFLRYTDPHNEKEFASKEKLKNWMPVKRYSGGAEHTTMHLLYSRFFHKALYDLGLVNEAEPYTNRMNRGLILGPDGNKMSKSKGNVIDPDEFVEKVGSDTVKMYLAFIGPYNEVGQYPWDLGGIAGLRRFLERSLKLMKKVVDGAEDTEEVVTLLHNTIKKVTADVEEYKFNTAISALMILLNRLEKEDVISPETGQYFVRLLAPFAPHLAEEMWQECLGNRESVHLMEWPKHDEQKIQEKTITYAVQVNGKTRATIDVEKILTKDKIIELSTESKGVKERIEGKEIIKKIFIPGRLINFVVKE